MLATNDKHIIEYSVSEIKNWERIRKQRTLEVLNKCQTQYEMELQNQQNRQPTLMDLDFTRVMPEDLDDDSKRESA